jgi:hypothetical protein
VTQAAPIGGFFERHEPDGASPTVLDAWTGGRPYGAFVNARSAFAALVAQSPAATVWLPAFLCADLMSKAFAARVRLYPVLEGFTPGLAPVEAEAKPGDIVLLAGAFGLPLAATPRRDDLVLVEDRAQALDAGPAVGWALYSPRKLLGVADGGLLVSPHAETPAPQPDATPDAEALWRAPDLRAADPLGRDNAAWHSANQAKEAAMAATGQRMTDRSRAILAQTSLESLTAPRRANWRRLDAGLSRWSALPETPGAPPLGYVLRLPPHQRDALLRGLHAQRIFAAVHWPRIVAPPEAFPRETAWTRELVTLPCDHRYGPGEMDRIADAATAVLG